MLPYRLASPVAAFVGLTTLDLVYGLDAPPSPNTKTVVERSVLVPGGPAANAAVAFAALGGRGRLFTVIGRHPLTSLLRDDLGARRVEMCDLAPDYDGEPPTAAIFVSPGGERLAASNGARRLPELASPPAGADPLAAPRPACVLLDGHLPGPCRDAARRARDAGVPVVLDGGNWKPVFPDLLPLVDYALCSEDCRPPGCSSPEDTLRYVRDAGAPYAAVTLGERPVLWSGPGGASGEIAPPAVDAVDTLGAGDFFHGAFCYALALGDRDYPAALELACRVAALSVQSFGTRAWLDALARQRNEIMQP